MYQEFLQFCKDHHSFSRYAFESQTPSPYLFNFCPITLSHQHFEKIKKFISIIYKIRNQVAYQQEILGHTPQHANYSVLMSFDFHIHENNIKLIEINTNASHFLTSFLLTDYIHETQNYPRPIKNSLELLQKSFLTEWQLFSGKTNFSKMALIDNNPKEQRAYFEFLMYKDFFKNYGWDCSIEDSSTVDPQKFDFIYNRDTDFFFDHLPKLKAAYIKKTSCISPHPEEYQLLADKNRLLLLSEESFLKKYIKQEEAFLIKEIIPEVFVMNQKSPEDVWQLRKKYFFKPMNAFGGKGVFNGASISHKLFQEIYSTNHYLAQEYAAPGTTQILDQNSNTVDAKWDLRVHVYAGNVLHLAARAYLGQTTNFRSYGGGFAAIFLQDY